MGKEVNEKLRDALLIKGQTKGADLPCFYIKEEWMDPPVPAMCWIFHLNYHWVAKGEIKSKEEGDRDYSDTWRIKIFHTEEAIQGYYEGMTETCIRWQIWPTRKDAYTALYGYLEEKVENHERVIGDLNARLREIEKFI